MSRKLLLLTGALFAGVLLLAGCAGGPAPTTPAPTRAVVNATSPAAVDGAGSTPSGASAGKSSAPAISKPSSNVTFETQSSNGGSVTVAVKPTTLAVGEPVAFDIAMNTHSVDLSDDMTKISVLRDDTGKEYKPTTWDGAEPGGHHRSGTLLFPALTGKPKYVELVVKGLAKVPERLFKWDLP